MLKVSAELIKQKITLNPPNPDTGNRGELVHLFQKTGLDYKAEQTKILKPTIAKLLLEDPQLSAKQISDKFGLESPNGEAIIRRLIVRIFGKYVRNENSIVEIRHYVRKKYSKYSSRNIDDFF